MSGNIIQLNEQFIHNELKTIVKNSVEETLITYNKLRKFNSKR